MSQAMPTCPLAQGDGQAWGKQLGRRAWQEQEGQQMRAGQDVADAESLHELGVNRWHAGVWGGM